MSASQQLEDETVSLRPAIAVGVGVGLVVLTAQAHGVPSLRVGVVPLLASALGTVAAIVWLMLEERSVVGFRRVWNDLAGDHDE